MKQRPREVNNRETLLKLSRSIPIPKIEIVSKQLSMMKSKEGKYVISRLQLLKRLMTDDATLAPRSHLTTGARYRLVFINKRTLWLICGCDSDTN